MSRMSQLARKVSKRKEELSKYKGKLTKGYEKVKREKSPEETINLCIQKINQNPWNMCAFSTLQGAARESGDYALAIYSAQEILRASEEGIIKVKGSEIIKSAYQNHLDYAKSQNLEERFGEEKAAQIRYVHSNKALKILGGIIGPQDKRARDLEAVVYSYKAALGNFTTLERKKGETVELDKRDHQPKQKSANQLLEEEYQRAIESGEKSDLNRIKKEYQDRFEKEPTNRGLALRIAKIDFHLDRFEDCISLIQTKRPTKQEDQEEADILLAESLIEIGHPLAAKMKLEEILDPGRNHALQVDYLLGTANEKIGMVDEAIRSFSRVIVRDLHYKDSKERIEKLRDSSKKD